MYRNGLFLIQYYAVVGLFFLPVKNAFGDRTCAIALLLALKTIFVTDI